MAPHRKFVTESHHMVSVIDKSTDIKFQPMWVVLFNDMLFIASGQTQKNRKLKDYKYIHSLWIRNFEDNELIGNSIEVKAPEECIFFIKFDKKDEKNQFYEILLNLIKDKTKCELKT